jgi:hypothetical protein
MTSRIPAFFVLGVLSATLGFADDPPAADPPAAPSTSPAAEFSPLTNSERFRNYVVGLVDYESILRATVSAGINQATNTPKEWGGGAEAYGERVGNAFGVHVIHRTLQYGISAALHEDNRYFVSGQTGFWRRTKYAVKNTFLARHDNGNQYFSFSRIGGAAGAAFISRVWQPPSTASAGDGATSFGITMGSDIGFNVFREFWPDIKKRFHKE